MHTRHAFIAICVATLVAGFSSAPYFPCEITHVASSVYAYWIFAIGVLLFATAELYVLIDHSWSLFCALVGLSFFALVDDRTSYVINSAAFVVVCVALACAAISIHQAPLYIAGIVILTLRMTAREYAIHWLERAPHIYHISYYAASPLTLVVFRFGALLHWLACVILYIIYEKKRKVTREKICARKNK